MRKLSEIIKEMACAVLKDPVGEPSSEAAHAALLFAHVAWNRANGVDPTHADYSEVLREFEESNARLWSELKSANAEALIAELAGYKQTHYAHDRRHLIKCGMVGDKVHVEWEEPTART